MENDVYLKVERIIISMNDLCQEDVVRKLITNSKRYLNKFEVKFLDNILEKRLNELSIDQFN